MKKHLSLTVYLASASAKSVQDYLDASDGDASAALGKARADVVEREKQNSTARRFRAAYEPLINKLSTAAGISLTMDPEDPEAAEAEAVGALKKLQGDAGTSSEATKKLEAAEAALKDLGIDPANLKDGVTAAKAKFANAEKADKLERQNAYRDAAEALGFDGEKLARILRDEPALPEKRTIKVKVAGSDGKETEQDQDVWGVPTRDDKGNETAFTAITAHADVKGFEAALKKAPITTDSTVTPDTGMPLFIDSKASAAPPAGAVLKLDTGFNTGSV